MFGQARPAFGNQAQPQQSFGSSLFGGVQSSNNTNGIGSSAFGMNQQQPNAQLDGARPPLGLNNNLMNGTLGSGGTSSGFGFGASPAGPQSQGTQIGTGGAPFTPFQEKDSTTNVTNSFQSITCMPEYRNFSFEELRLQDYQAGRRLPVAGSTVSATNSLFGNKPVASSGFGNSAGSSTGTGNLFGNPTSFGSNNNTFGASSSSPFNNLNKPSGGLFGNNLNQNSGSSSLFGNTGSSSPFAQQPNGSTSNSLFGNSANSNNTLFGSNAAASNNAGSGTFSQANAQQGFGMNNSNSFGSQQSSSNNPFGQQQQPSAGIFGQSQQGFGTTGSIGAIGNKPAGTSLFGQSNNTFGNNGSSLFGQQQQQPQQTTSGLFGQSNSQPGSNSIFGQNQQQTGGLLGSQQAGSLGFGQQPSQNSGGLFGQKPATTGLFGQNNQQQGSSMFGQNNQQQAGGLFGQKPTNTTTFGNSANQNQTTQQQNSGGLFGNASAAGGPFGSNNQQTQQSQNGSLFGQSNPLQSQQGGGIFGQNNTQQQGGGLFGSNPNQQQNGSLFGQNNNQPAQQNSGLFGAKPSGGLNNGGLFGNNQGSNTLAANGGGLFGGTKPGGTSGGLFGNTTQNKTATAGLFGNPNSNGISNSTTGGLFGNKPSMAAGNNTGLASNTNGSNGLFGNTNSASKGLTAGSNAIGTNSLFGGGLLGNNSSFGNSNNTGSILTGNQNNNPSFGGSMLNTNASLQQQQQQQPQQTITANPYGTSDLFAKVRVSVPYNYAETSIKSEPAVTRVSSDRKKILPIRQAYKLVPKPLFSSSTDLNSVNGNHSKSPSQKSTPSQKRIQPLKKDTASNDTTPETERAISAISSMLYSAENNNFKQMIMRNKALADVAKPKNIHTKEENTDEVDAVENQSSALNSDLLLAYPKSDHNGNYDSETNNSRANLRPSSNEDQSVSLQSYPQAIDGQRFVELGIKRDDINWVNENYFISPSMETLSSYSTLRLRQIKNLIVGHREYGFIEFLDFVNLSTIPLALLCGKFITFEKGNCAVYTDIEEKPAPGEGINVRARITLMKAYPLNKSTRSPITQPDHPLVKRHIDKLKGIPGTKFESYDPVSGKYVFVVNNIIL